MDRSEEFEAGLSGAYSVKDPVEETLVQDILRAGPFGVFPYTVWYLAWCLTQAQPSARIRTRTLLREKDTWTLNSYCTGTGGDSATVEIILYMLCPELQFNTNFECDIKPMALKFCTMFRKLRDKAMNRSYDNPCHYGDISDLCSKPQCLIHGKVCDQKAHSAAADGGSVGFSCKDFSTMAVTKMPDGAVLTPPKDGSAAKGTTAGSTARTWTGFCRHQKYAPTGITWIENLLDIRKDKNRQIIRSDLAEIGTGVRLYVRRPRQAGIPASRPRCYGAGLNWELLECTREDLEPIFDKIGQYLTAFELPNCFSLEDFLLKADDETLEIVYKQLLADHSADGGPTTANVDFRKVPA